MKKLFWYKNGNCDVTIYKDGTKVREYEGTPLPEFPESIDLKITNRCYGGCEFCHEKSNAFGNNANIDDIYDIVNDLPFGVELALGGGDILVRQDIFILLEELKRKGLIANATVNAKCLNTYATCKINKFRNEKLIYGLGVSYSPEEEESIAHILDDNTVVHLIMGIDSIDTVFKYPKVLVLGYKEFGRGLDYYKMHKDSIDTNKLNWINNVDKLMNSSNLISFDNLAVGQLDLKSKLPGDVYNKYYMGDDGQFTMYIDAVENKFAASSTSERFERRDMSAVECFKEILKISQNSA
jgi:hypothetical protein